MGRVQVTRPQPCAIPSQQQHRSVPTAIGNQPSHRPMTDAASSQLADAVVLCSLSLHAAFNRTCHHRLKHHYSSVTVNDKWNQLPLKQHVMQQERLRLFSQEQQQSAWSMNVSCQQLLESTVQTVRNKMHALMHHTRAIHASNNNVQPTSRCQ